jgi:type IX secretion system PorP/SprF family membrane protein
MDFYRMRQYIKVIFLCCLLFTVIGVNAQQEPDFSHNMFNNVSINPGFAGEVNAISAIGIAHQQWQGVQDEYGTGISPKTYSISIHSPLSFLHGGLGLNIYQDQLGYQKEVGVKLMYAYRMDVGMGNLGIGFQVDFVNGTTDVEGLRNGAIHPDDPLLNDANPSDMIFDFGLGVHYVVPGKYYLGLSSTRLLETKSDKLYYQYKRHYFLTGGYQFSFRSNPAFEIDPSLLVKYDGVKVEMDIAALLMYNNKVWGGVSFSTIGMIDPISVLVGVKIKDIKIGYSYGIPTSKFGSGGTHEILVGYDFKIEFDKGGRSYKNTRYL